jgi:hypothetical protein
MANTSSAKGISIDSYSFNQDQYREMLKHLKKLCEYAADQKPLDFSPPSKDTKTTTGGES